MESALESVPVTREVTQCGPGALGHVTHPSCRRRTEASRPFHVALSSVRGVTWGAGGGGHATGNFLRSPGGRPAPRDPAAALGKTTGEIKWKHKSATQSLLRPRPDPHPVHPGRGSAPGARPAQQGSPWSWAPSGWAFPPSGSHRGSPSPGGHGNRSLSPSLPPSLQPLESVDPGTFQASLYQTLAGQPGQVPAPP